MKKLFMDDDTYLGIVRNLCVDELRTLHSIGYDFYIYLDNRIPFYVTISGVTVNLKERDSFYWLMEEEVHDILKDVPKDYKFKVAIDGKAMEVNFLI